MAGFNMVSFVKFVINTKHLKLKVKINSIRKLSSIPRPLYTKIY